MDFDAPLATAVQATPLHRIEPPQPAATPDAAATTATGDEQAPRQRRPGGSAMGRLMRRSRTRTAGIRFEWAMRSCGPVLRVVATWTDRQGQPHHTSYSVQCNGIEGALDRAIASRTSCGAPQPDREDLLQRLHKEFATAPYGPAFAAPSRPVMESAELQAA